METINEKGAASPVSPEQQKKRKFYLMVPVLILPFLTMAFWALGGGSAQPVAASVAQEKGINMALPSAQFKENESTSKMDLYQTAAKDSAKVKNGLSKDFVQNMGFNADKIDSNIAQPVDAAQYPGNRSKADLQSDRISAKLAEINRQINQPAKAYAREDDDDRQVKKLHKMMNAMNSKPEKDPEMEQLDAMLNKIQAIQNPTVNTPKPAEKKMDETSFKAIPAMVDGKQKVMNGGTVRLILTDSVRIGGELLEKGQLLFGACQVTNQRLLLTIQNIRLDKQIIPVSMTVFSLDGMQGIPAPEADLGIAAGSGADNAVQSMQIMSMDPSIGAQAAAGGINAAKGLFSKKVHKIKVRLEDKFPVLLKINKS